jgi:hopanoid biosynthesis associated RND transporter like protein HpnN
VLVLVLLALGSPAGYYAANHFAMDTRTESLISAQTQWRKRAAVYDSAFPRQNNLIVVVVDGATPELTEAATASLTTALGQQHEVLPYVHRPDGGDFFARDGLLFLSVADVQAATQKLVAAQPFLGGLAADPSLRGISQNLSTALLGVAHGQASLAQLDQPMVGFTRTFDAVLADRPNFLSWQGLITGQAPDHRQTRKFIEIQPRLDYHRLKPGEQASDAIRQTVARLGLTQSNGVSVRLTGAIPMADDEFGSLTERARLMATLMMLAVLGTLWFAVRSARLIFAILLTVFVGLTLTTAIGLLAVGAFNLISVAFIALFVGLGVDFGIQFCVRYRHERFAAGDLDQALHNTGVSIGPALMLAAAATAAGFYSFLPTSYRGVAELGFVAGTGMLITFGLSVSLLPALVKLLSPRGESEEVGFKTLAPLDHFVTSRKRFIVMGALVIALLGALALPRLAFDFDPLDLRNPHVESVATALELLRSPDTSPNTVDVLAPSHDAAKALSARLAALPPVERAVWIDSFVPEGQKEKLAIISDAETILDPTLNPFLTRPPPSDGEVVAGFRALATQLDAIAAAKHDAPSVHARALAQALNRMASATPATRKRAESAFVPGLQSMLGMVRAMLSPYPVTDRTLPRELVGDWVSADGQYRIAVSPNSRVHDNESLRAFTSAVRRVAPGATGEPILIQESGRTIVRAFIQAGALSFVTIVVLLVWFLRSVRFTALTVIPLLVAAMGTMATCVAIGLPLNYANIIALPLLLGIGVAFDIYFVMAWRAGERNLLGSSLTRAVILSAATTASAFGTLWISSHPGTASMGELLAISLSWILIAVLFLLPALLSYAAPKAGLPEIVPDRRSL